MNTITIKNIEDYSKCPNFCKYNWSNQLSVLNPKTSALRRIIKSCYRDQANLERKIVWKTVRSRVHTELSPLLKDMHLDNYHRMALKMMDTLRAWYINYYREGPELCLHGLALKASVPGVGIELEGEVDALLLEEDNVSMITINTEVNPNKLELYRGMGLRAKAWLLSQQGVIVNNFVVININNDTIKVSKLRIEDPLDFMYKTEKAIQVIAGGIKHKVYYPSVTEACLSCPYGSICS